MSEIDYGFCNESREVVLTFDNDPLFPLPIHLDTGTYCWCGGIEWFDKNGNAVHKED